MIGIEMFNEDKKNIMLWFLCCMTLVISSSTPASDVGNEEDMFEMSLEELMDVEIESSASLTRTTRRKQPSTVTTITNEQIQSSGARSLDELLDIYVPNLQTIRDYYSYNNMGLRGIISDADNKYLLLVNGFELNEHTAHGAISERDLPMLTDIDHVDIVRGPGSTLYGPGALAMVINIVTENASTFKGTEIISRVGTIEEFYSTEIKHGMQFDDASNLYLFAGISEYPGAQESDSPVSLGLDWYSAQQMTPRDQGSWRGLPKLKFHGEYQKDDFNIWARYTRGGKHQVNIPYWDWPHVMTPGQGYQQFSLNSSLLQTINDELEINYSLGFTMFDYERYVPANTNVGIESHREDRYLAKMVTRWTPSDSHSVAIGTSVTYSRLGQKSLGFPGGPAFIYSLDPSNNVSPWSTTMYSVFGEHQWNINPEWTSFLGFRWDKHTYTTDMYSPRISLVYTPTKQDTFKVMASRSSRMSFEGEMKADWNSTKKHIEPEELDAYELRYERQQNDRLWFAGSAFFHDHKLKGYDGNTGQFGSPIGDVTSWGLELEAIYKTEKTEIGISHCYTKLSTFELANDNISQYLSAKPSGYGDDFANWHNNISKLTAKYKVDEKLTLDGSVRIYWQIPGARDFNRQWMDEYGDNRAEEPSWESIFLNLGLTYKVNEDMDVRFDGYNLVGFIDKEFNRKMYGFGNFSDYRSVAPAFGFTVKCRF